jgi:hypothetical protein
MVILMKPPIFVGSFSEKESLIMEISFGEFDEENICPPGGYLRSHESYEREAY